MTSLHIHTCCQYLTAGGDWRHDDHTARIIVKCVKGEEFGGYRDFPLNGKNTRIDKNSMNAGLELVGSVMASQLLQIVQEAVTLVPVPNSHACVGVAPNFRTLELAKIIARYAGGLATAYPGILWDTPREKQHQAGGWRHASIYIPKIRLVEPIVGPVILIDDVVTSGSQMLACTYVLRKHGLSVPFGMAAGRTTNVQTSDVLTWVSSDITQLIF